MRTQATGARSLFSLFSSKESVPLLFFLERKTGQLAREAQPLRRTSSFLFRRKEAKENHLRNSCFSALLPLSPCATQNGRFTYEPSVFPFRAGRAEKYLFSERHPPPQCLLFLFFKKRKRSPLEEKKTSPFIEEKKSFPLYVPGIRLIKKLAR